MPTQSNDSLLPPRWVLFSLFCVGSIYLMVELRELVVLLVLGFCIAYVAEPAVSALERRRVSRAWGAIIVFLSAALIVTLLLVTAVPTIQRESENFLSNFGSYLDLARERGRSIVRTLQGVLPARMRTMIGVEEQAFSLSSLGEIVTQSAGKLLKNLGAALMNGYDLIVMIVNAVLLPFITYYFIVDFPKFEVLFVALFPRERRGKVREILGEISGYVSGFVRGQFLIGAILTVLYWFGLGIVGVQLWFLLGVLSGFGNMIPYFGLISGLVASSIMTLVTFGDLTHLLWVWGIYGCVQMVESFLISPVVLGKNVGLSPLTIILAIFIGGSLFGLLGVLLAVPGAAVVLVLLKHLHKAAISEPESEPPPMI